MIMRGRGALDQLDVADFSESRASVNIGLLPVAPLTGVRRAVPLGERLQAASPRCVALSYGKTPESNIVAGWFS